MKWELSRLTNSSDEHHSESKLELPWVDSGNQILVENNCIVQRTEEVPQHDQTDNEEDVTNTCGEERLLCRIGCTWLFVIESDEKIGTKTHQFPEDEEPKEGVSENHSKHT